MKGKLLKRQKGYCPICGVEITESELLSGVVDIDHIIPISKGGSRMKISNLRLIHENCHYGVVHRKARTQ